MTLTLQSNWTCLSQHATLVCIIGLSQMTNIVSNSLPSSPPLPCQILNTQELWYKNYINGRNPHHHYHRHNLCELSSCLIPHKNLMNILNQDLSILQITIDKHEHICLLTVFILLQLVLLHVKLFMCIMCYYVTTTTTINYIKYLQLKFS